MRPETSGRAEVGLLGWPVSQSLSPRLMNRAFALRGLPWRYHAFAVPPEELAQEVARLRARGIRGLNITIPHKERVLDLLDEVSREARMMGAVNCIEVQDGQFHGHNTDGAAFQESMSAIAGFRPAGKRAVILGAGGAARAVAHTLAAEGIARLIVLARRPEQASALIAGLAGLAGPAGPALEAGLLGSRARATVRRAIAEADLLVNATPVGMASTPYAGMIPLPDLRSLRPGLLVCDLVYHPRETPLRRAARERGADTLDGLPMLAFQAAAAYRLWTRSPFSGSEMLELAENTLAEDIPPKEEDRHE